MNILYENLPGIFSELVDGNIHIPLSGIKNVIGIFGTTSSGPALYPLQVGKYAKVEYGFGTAGSAIDGYYETLLGKPENVVITRIGSTPAMAFIGEGTIVTTIEHGAVSSSYGIAVDKAATIFRVYLLDATYGNTLVWSNDEGELDDVSQYSYVDVDIDEDNLYGQLTGDIGTTSAPVPISTMISTPTDDYCGIEGTTGAEGPLTNKERYTGMLKGFLACESVNLDQIVVPGAFIDAPTLSDDIKESVVVINTDGALVSSSPAAGDVYEIDVNSEAYTITGVTTEPALGLAIASAVTESNLVDATYSSIDKEVTITATTGGIPVDVTLTITPDGGSATTNITDIAITESWSDNKYIEKKTEVALVPIDSVVTDKARIFKVTDRHAIKETVDVLLDTGGGSGFVSIATQPAIYHIGGTIYVVFTTNQDISSGNDYAVTYYRAQNDALPFVHWEQSDGELVVSWSPFPTATHSEANFGWEIARFAYELSANDNECLGVIGVLPPHSFTPRDISRWIGQEPTYNINGTMTHVGTGLFYNKFMVGNSNGGPGMFATDTRMINGLPLVDSNGHRVDLGRFLAVIVGYGLISSGNPQKAARYVGSTEKIFASMDQMLEPNQAATHKTIPGVKIPYRITKRQQDMLTKWNYTVIANEQITGRTYVVSSPTAATVDSDYQQRQTMKIAIALINDFREICNPFIGNAFSPRIIKAQEALLKARYSLRQSEGWIEWSDLSIKASPMDRILNKEYVYLKFMPASELRQIFLYSSLSTEK